MPLDEPEHGRRDEGLRHARDPKRRVAAQRRATVDIREAGADGHVEPGRPDRDDFAGNRGVGRHVRLDRGDDAPACDRGVHGRAGRGTDEERDEHQQHAEHK